MKNESNPQGWKKFLELLKCPSIASAIKAINYVKSLEQVWEGIVAVPPRSFLDVAVKEFHKNTCISDDLVFSTGFCLITQYLAEKGASIQMRDGQIIRMDLMTVLLAGTGQMKTFCYGKILSALKGVWQPNCLPDCGSSAGLLTAIAQSKGKPSLWRIEEFGEFWGLMTKKESHIETPRTILMAYDGTPISRQLKDQRIDTAAPYLSIFGTTVTKNLANQLRPEDWNSGFAQRIGFVKCEPDPARDWKKGKYAMLDRINLNKITKAFQEQIQIPIHKKYTLSKEAIRQIQRAWEQMANQGVEHEFVRRIEFRSFKYAVVYHWLLGKGSNILDEEDIAWAFRLAMRNIADIAEILDKVEGAEYFDLIEKAEKLRIKLGTKFTPRMILMRLHRHIRNMDEANAVYAFVMDKEKK